jgi:hypothetical protein
MNQLATELLKKIESKTATVGIVGLSLIHIDAADETRPV